MSFDMAKKNYFNKITIFRLLIVLPIYLYGQFDTINKFNASGKKQGYWVCYIDSIFQVTTDTLKAAYFAYDYFDDGRNMTKVGVRSMKVHHTEAYSEITGNQKIKILSGKIILYDKRKRTRIVEIYKLGLLLSVKSYNKYTRVNGKECLSEFLNFELRYENEIGSFYFEENLDCSSTDRVKKYWFRKKDGKWQAIKIE
jgi:hypothetical protein